MTNLIELVRDVNVWLNYFGWACALALFTMATIFVARRLS